MWLHLDWPCLCWVGLHEWVVGVEFKGKRMVEDRVYHCTVCGKETPCPRS